MAPNSEASCDGKAAMQVRDASPAGESDVCDWDVCGKLPISINLISLFNHPDHLS